MQPLKDAICTVQSLQITFAFPRDSRVWATDLAICLLLEIQFGWNTLFGFRRRIKIERLLGLIFFIEYVEISPKENTYKEDCTFFLAHKSSIRSLVGSALLRPEVEVETWKY